MAHLAQENFSPLNIAVLTVSDTRTEANDTSGQYFVEELRAAGHTLADKQIVIDDIYQIRATLSQWIASSDIQAVLVTGGTGFTARDNTPEAVSVLFDKQVEGFGELFRQLSFNDIGTSTVQSRAIAGMANGTIVFCVPGSTNACKTAWQEIIREQLDATTRPCNFVPHLKQSSAALCQSRETH